MSALLRPDLLVIVVFALPGFLFTILYLAGAGRSYEAHVMLAVLSLIFLHAAAAAVVAAAWRLLISATVERRLNSQR